MKSRILILFLFCAAGLSQVSDRSSEGSNLVVRGESSIGGIGIGCWQDDMVVAADGSVYVYQHKVTWPTPEGDSATLIAELKSIGPTGQVLWTLNFSEYDGYFISGIRVQGGKLILQFDLAFFISHMGDEIEINPPAASFLLALDVATGQKIWTWNYPNFPMGFQIAENGNLLTRYTVFGFASVDQHLVALSSEGVQLYDLMIRSESAIGLPDQSQSGATTTDGNGNSPQ